MTKEEWDKVEASMQSPYGSIKLICDGYELHLATILSRRKLTTMIYVNGWNKGEWLSNDCEERRRFCRAIVYPCYRAKEKKLWLKLGKSYLKSRGINLDKTLTTYTSFWPGFRSLKAHLIKNNTSIELAPEVNP